MSRFALTIAAAFFATAAQAHPGHGASGVHFHFESLHLLAGLAIGVAAAAAFGVARRRRARLAR